MNDGAYHNSSTGQFVSKATADADPEGTQFVTNSTPDPMDQDLARIVSLTDSRPIYESTLLGRRFSNADPRELTLEMRLWAEQQTGVKP